MAGRLFLRVAAILFVAVGVFFLIGSSATAGGPARFMMRTLVGERVLEGQPLAWTDETMFLLGRDGQLYEFAPQDAQDSRKLGPAFRGYTSSEMRTRLRDEFDKSFEITTTQHFVVVHPRGPWSDWADRLEALYRSFTHGMQVRGFRIRSPQVQLVAVVFRNQDDYFRHAAASGTPLQPGTMGHYAPQSNRIFLFDINQSSGEDWSVNAETIIHEATHQTAYNVGVHRRFAVQPRWLVEGLALMYEARGVWDARSIYTRDDRVNRGRLADFRHYRPQHSGGSIAELIASDQLFRSSTGFAYAEAWTLSFFLSETRPQEYSRYLELVAQRKIFALYPVQERLADFMQIFGTDLKLLESQMTRFVADLK